MFSFLSSCGINPVGILLEQRALPAKRMTPEDAGVLGKRFKLTTPLSVGYFENGSPDMAVITDPDSTINYDFTLLASLGKGTIFVVNDAWEEAGEFGTWDTVFWGRLVSPITGHKNLQFRCRSIQDQAQWPYAGGNPFGKEYAVRVR